MTDLQALAEMIRPAIERVWDAIGSDVLAIPDVHIDNQGAIEMCVDADRLRTYGGADGAAADDLIEEAHGEHGWDDVIAALDSQIDLY